MSAPICIGCKKTPEEISEYVDFAEIYGITPTEFVCTEDGTYNPYNGHFACTMCYINMGQPSSPYGWVAP